MSDALYERYKDALRRGHVAAQRGRFDEALAAYGEAGTIAPDRAMPHVGIGGVLARLGRTAEAPGRLRRRARARTRRRGRPPRPRRLLALAGDRGRAAETLDRLVGRAGRRPAASAMPPTPAGVALELAESRSRRRGRRGRSPARLREAGDTAAADALAAALGIEPGSDSAAAAPEPKRDPRRAVLSAAAVLTADGRRRSTAATPTGPRGATWRPPRRSARSGNLHAAIDACYQALAVAPADRRRPPRARRSCTSIAAGGRRPRTSSCCSAGWPTSPPTT